MSRRLSHPALIRFDGSAGGSEETYNAPLQAGARTVVATRWGVGDRAALRTVRPFYDALAAGLPVADALRAAKLERLGRGAPTREWASFVAVGDPLIRIPLRRPAPGWHPWVVGLSGVVALLGMILYLGIGRRGRIRKRRQAVG